MKMLLMAFVAAMLVNTCIGAESEPNEPAIDMRLRSTEAHGAKVFYDAAAAVHLPVFERSYGQFCDSLAQRNAALEKADEFASQIDTLVGSTDANEAVRNAIVERYRSGYTNCEECRHQYGNCKDFDYNAYSKYSGHIPHVQWICGSCKDVSCWDE